MQINKKPQQDKDQDKSQTQEQNRPSKVLFALKQNVKIVYLDNHLLVAFKPASLATQKIAKSSRSKSAKEQKGALDNLANDPENSLEDILKAFLKAKFKKTGNVFLHAIHRLDKPVFGLVAFARTSKALSRLNQQMREKKFEKKYLALVEGRVKERIKILENFIIHAQHKAKIVTKKNKKAKLARLQFKNIRSQKKQSLLEITLLTGRYHQIRAQLAAFGHPIIGDAKYGSKLSLNEGNLYLQAFYLAFFHPVTNHRLSFFKTVF